MLLFFLSGKNSYQLQEEFAVWLAGLYVGRQSYEKVHRIQ